MAFVGFIFYALFSGIISEARNVVIAR